MPTKLEEDYGVIENKVVQLTVIIGQGHYGSSTVKLNDENIFIGENIKDLDIGEGQDISGKTLSIRTKVTVTNPNTNLTSVSYVLKGGKEDETFDLEETATNKTVDYSASFNLIN